MSRGANSAKCPICGAARQAAYRPFCSKRCADIDLAKWLDGTYVVGSEPAGEADGEAGR